MDGVMVVVTGDILVMPGAVTLDTGDLVTDTAMDGITQDITGEDMATDITITLIITQEEALPPIMVEEITLQAETMLQIEAFLTEATPTAIEITPTEVIITTPLTDEASTLITEEVLL